MKRLALLSVTAVMALLLSACGGNAEKKVDVKAQTEMEQSKAKLNEANTEVNSGLTDGASVANPEVVKDNSDATTATPAPDDAAQPSTEESQ